ncbi:MAG: hypothetical protein V4503_05525 [Gemmatimonadota bacterium]
MNIRLCAAAALLLATPLAAQETSVTLFSSGRVLVRRTLPISVPAGTTTLPVALGQIASGDFAVLEPGVTLERFAFDPAWNEEALLRRHVGERFMLRRGTDTPFPAKLISMDPERWDIGLDGNAVVFGRPGQVLWKESMVPAAPTADLTLKSDRSHQGVKVMYSLSGANWDASYRLYLGGSGRVEGNALISTGTLDFANAEVQLLAGDIGAPPMAPGPRPMYEMAARAKAMDVAGGAPSEESVGEARLYTLPDRVSFTPGTQLMLPLFNPVGAKAERRYTVAGGIPYYGGFGQVEDEQEVPVSVAYRLDRKLGTAFGDLPLPAGSVQVFDLDKAGRTQLVGMGNIGHTAPGEEMLVNTGTAFDVTARRTQTGFTTSRTTTTPTRTIAMATFRVDLQNAKDSAVVVEVREDRGGEWSVVESSVTPQKRSASRVVFPVTVPAKGKATLTYRVRVVW